MSEVSFGGLNQIGNQVVPPLELDIDLREGIAEAVPQFHESVVLPDHKEGSDDRDQNNDRDEEAAPFKKEPRMSNNFP